MEGSSPGPNKGYQKQVKKDAPLPPKQKIHPTTDYSSPAAKKWPKFIEAIGSGNVDSVKQFIDEGMNINLLRDGVTPLMIAASAGKRDVAEAFLQAGVNINERGEDGGTALHKAAFDQEDTGIIELLVQSGVDVGAKNKAGKTALQLAEGKGHRGVILVINKHLAQQNADAREWEDFLNSAEGKPFKEQRKYDSLTRYSKLWWLPIPVFAVVGVLPGLLFGMPVVTGVIGAVIGSLIGGVVLLREKQIRKYLDKIGPLPELDIHSLRLKRQAGEPIFSGKKEERESLGDFSETLAVEEASATASNDTVVIRESAPPVRSAGPTIVIIAVTVLVLLLLGGAVFYKKDALGRWYYVKKLEQGGVSFSNAAYLEAAATNNAAALDLFIKAGIPTDAENEKGQTALIIAAEKGHVNVIEKLAKLNPALLNHADKSGKTALMIAARQGREPAVQALLANGADINYVVPANPGAATALQAVLDAADFKEQHMAMVKYLLEHGADVKVRNGAGESPLMFIADGGRIEAARLLLEKGADVDAADIKGGFPLLLAACKGNSALVALLAEKGANMKAALPDGQTPLMCAVQMGYADTVRMLLEKGADANAKAKNGATALYDATRMGQVEIAKLLLARGADRTSGYIPDSFKALKGKSVALAVKKSKLNAVLGKIGKTASQDGYTLHADATKALLVTMKAKASWNRILQDLAAKNRLVLVVKEKEVFLLP